MIRFAHLARFSAAIAAIGISAVITRSANGQSPVGASDAESIENGNPRDVAAAKEALGGWWSEALKTRDERLAWWREARFGCFIHWGVYSGPVGETEILFLPSRIGDGDALQLFEIDLGPVGS